MIIKVDTKDLQGTNEDYEKSNNHSINKHLIVCVIVSVVSLCVLAFTWMNIDVIKIEKETKYHQLSGLGHHISSNVTKILNKTNNSSLFLQTNWSTNTLKFPHLIIYKQAKLKNEVNITPLEWLWLNNISSIVIFADSHGLRWTKSLMKYFDSKFENNNTTASGTHKQCNKILSEKGSKFVNKEFYNIDNMVTHVRECSGCQSYIMNCYYSNISVIKIKYLSQEFVFDTEIQRYLTHWNKNDLLHSIGIKKCPTNWLLGCIGEISYSTQEFYLKNYFKLTGYPNIIIRFATYQHDIGRFTEIEFKRNFRYYLQLLLDYVNTNNTKIIWISTMSFATVWHNESTMHLNEKIWRFNNIAVSEIVKYAKNSIHIFPLDLFQISLQLRQLYGNRWNENHGLDTAHLHAMFYDQLMQLVWKWIQMNYQL
eukprot:357751_1